VAIILFGGEKGGTGKTTLAVNIATMLAVDGRRVVLLDTDCQGSAYYWGRIRAEEGRIPEVPCLRHYGKTLPTEIEKLSADNQDLIIDAGGRDSVELRYALGMADRAYLPIQSFQFDIWTLQQMENLLAMAGKVNRRLVGYLVLNRVMTHPLVVEDREAREFVDQQCFAHLRLLTAQLHDRIASRKAARSGLAVVEDGRDTKAVAEIKRLYEEIHDA
jgi:chromosome partitioning protein